MPLVYRKQALFEWMIEPIVEMELKRGSVYPFPEGQSAQGFEKAVKELTDCLHNQAFDDFGAWPSVSGIDLEIKLSEHSSTKAYLKRQSDQTIRNLERIKRRIVHAPSDRALAEVLGTFGAEPLQEFSQRQEAVYFLLCDPRQQRPDFLKDPVATSEQNLASDRMGEEVEALDLRECPYDLSKLRTLQQRDRFFFVFKHRPKFVNVKAEFPKIKTPQAWQSSINRINGNLLDCEILFSQTDRCYEVVKLST